MNMFDLADKATIVTSCNTGWRQRIALDLVHAGADIAGVGYEPVHVDGVWLAC